MLYPAYLERRRGLLPRVVLGVVVAVLVVGVGVFVWMKRTGNVATNSTVNTNVTTNTNSSNGTDNWWSYTSPDLQFQLRYPRTLVADTKDDGVYFEDSKKTVVAAVVLQSRGVDEHLTTWHTTQAVGQLTVDGAAAKKFVYQTCGQNGNAQVCGPQTVAFVVEQPGNFLAFEFYGDKALDATEQAMLDSLNLLAVDLNE